MADIDLGEMEFDTPARIGNAQIMYLVQEIELCMMHLSRCPSSTNNEMLPADLSIFTKFMTDWSGWFETFASQPRAYMPNAAPKPKPVPTPTPISRVQNSVVQYWLHELNQMRTQLLYGEDAEMMSGLNPSMCDAVVRPWVIKLQQTIAEAEKATVPGGDPGLKWKPDADLQEPGVNVGEPR